MIGQTISHYKILEKLGEGGMGVVYKALDLNLNRPTALKFLPHHFTANEAEQARFLMEAQAASILNHPNICIIHSIGEHEGQQFIDMEYVDGMTLRKKITASPLKVNEAVAYAVQIGEALHEAHSKGIVHRDVKSENIMINSKDQVKVMDFGLAKLKGAVKLAQSSSTSGTLAYMAPEQIQGTEVDARADIFSFGVVLYEMLTGHIPFRGEHEPAMMYSILNEAPQPIQKYRDDIPSELLHILDRALEKDPNDRYQSAADMVSELGRLQRQSSRISLPARPVPQKQSFGLRWRANKRLVLGAASAAVLMAIVFFLLRTGQENSVNRKSIAVLPFRNLSEDKENEFFSDGITEDIITQLSKVSELKVISRTSVLRYKNSEKSLREIARELGVASVLEGSVRRAGSRIRIVGQLVDANSDEHIWAETYDREFKDIFDIQSDVAKQIAAALKAQLSPAEKERIEKKSTENLDAYTLYLRGREYYYRYHKQDNQNAIKLFKKALELDPNYALAYAGLGDAYGQAVNKFGSGRQWNDTGIVYSQKAITLDPNLAEGYKALALCYVNNMKLREAVELNKKALERNPNYFSAVGNIGFDYWYMGKYDEALPWMKKSVSLNPAFAFGYSGVAVVYRDLLEDDKAMQWFNKALELQPDLVDVRLGLAQMYTLEEKFPKALEQAEKILSSFPNETRALILMGDIRIAMGDFRTAKEFYEKAIADSALESAPKTELDLILWKTGRPEDALKMFSKRTIELQKALAEGNESGDVPYELASIYAIQENREEAYRWLQRAVDMGWRNYRSALIDPSFEKLRNEDAFEKIIEGVKAQVNTMRKRVEQLEDQ
jgi:serine/threonine protein kinase/Tfp pilus assembly protein PilF